MLFSSAKAGYNEQLAKDMLLASALAYCPSDRTMTGDCGAATTETEKIGIKPIHALDNTDVSNPISYSIMTRVSKKQLIVGFSGTQGVSELIHEIEKVLPVAYDIHGAPQAEVFDFFYEHYVTDFRNDFLVKIEEFVKIYKGYSVIFTGHSLGGALTVHAAADAILGGYLDANSVYIYTYGQPRVGNIYFNNLFRNQVNDMFRLVHNKDLVPHVPPCIPNLSGGCVSDGPALPYPYHAPQEIWYQEDFTSFTICSSSEGEDPSCSNSVLNDSINDHTHYFGIEVGHLHNDDNESRAEKDVSDLVKISY